MYLNEMGVYDLKSYLSKRHLGAIIEDGKITGFTQTRKRKSFKRLIAKVKRFIWEVLITVLTIIILGSAGAMVFIILEII